MYDVKIGRVFLVVVAVALCRWCWVGHCGCGCGIFGRWLRDGRSGSAKIVCWGKGREQKRSLTPFSTDRSMPIFWHPAPRIDATFWHRFFLKILNFFLRNGRTSRLSFVVSLQPISFHLLSPICDLRSSRHANWPCWEGCFLHHAGEKKHRSLQGWSLYRSRNRRNDERKKRRNTFELRRHEWLRSHRRLPKYLPVLFSMPLLAWTGPLWEARWVRRKPSRRRHWKKLLNKQIRHALYRESTAFIHGYLGKGNRIELPQCVRGDIIDMCPDPDGEYTGFCDVTK